jgi:FkbM family methyltransferase
MVEIHKRHYKEFGNIIGKDIYKVRGWEIGHFDYIIDIGANVGMFSMLMRMLQPQAKVIAVEPAEEAYPYLDLIAEAFSIDVVKKALGNGSPLYFKKRTMMLNAMFVEEEGDDSYEVESITLPELFSQYNIVHGKNCMIKIDCEGGEKYLFGDRETGNILRAAGQVSMEVHFISRGTQFDFWPTWEEIDEWVKDTFTHHTIQYYLSSKHRGYGHFCIRPKR